MSTSEIMDKISKLTPAEKLFIIEKTFKELLLSNVAQQMHLASDSLENEYRTNEELTAFTSINLEEFYETK
jgi:hypothetical protein